MTTADAWELAAQRFEGLRRPASPLALARLIDPATRTSPALQAIDTALVELMDDESPFDALFIAIPPQEGKSTLCARRLPTWTLDREPDAQIAIVSYQEDIGVRWGREIKRDISLGPAGSVHIDIRRDSSAAGRWDTAEGGGLFCAGIGGPLTGRTVSRLLVIDDPVKDRAAAESQVARDSAWDWFENVALTRLGPRTRVVLIMCMTGDTPVLMGDGTEKPLREVRPGDTVATYENGKVTTATVRNWANQGPDTVFKIRMRSGRTVRANARHPFLTVDAQGAESWQRTGTLRPGTRIRTVTGASTVESPAPPKAAVLSSGTGTPLRSSMRQPSTYGTETDEVAEITPCGTEDVYDIEVERTHNFIANGLCASNTRWHEDDLAGRIMSRPSALRWRQLVIPAIAGKNDPLGRAPGEELQSVRGRDPHHFRRLQATMSSYVFSGLYQQTPTAPEGNFFRRATFRYWRPLPPWTDGRERIDLEGRPVTLPDTWRFITMDFAASLKKSADYTVAACWAITGEGDLVLLDRVRERVPDHMHFAMALPLLERWKAQQVYVESNWWSSTFVSDARDHGIPVALVKADTDKLTRAIPAAGRVHSGKTWWPADATWLDEWCDELAIFPQGSHDDQVDVLAYAARVQVNEWTPARDVPRRGLSVTEQAINTAGQAATGNGQHELDIMGLQY